MGLFSRRRRADADLDRSPDAALTESEDLGPGPWDAKEAPESPTTARGWIDLGSVRVPAVDGMQLRLEAPTQDAEPVAVVLVLGGSTLELRAFAAPRTEGLWEELRGDIASELARSKASYRVATGPYGPELLAQVPVLSPDGERMSVPARFIGVDGPRWFLRGVLQGRAASDESAAEALRDVFSEVVVVRDSRPRPPRELLPLHPPGGAAASEAPEIAGIDPLTPGPTIAEVR